MTKMHLYTASCTGNEKNCRYPNETAVSSEESLRAAVARDHVCAKYKNSYRSNDNFLSADCIVMDCDNDHSDDPKDWITPEALAEELSDVDFGITESRHNNMPKDGKSARPRFHIYMRTREYTDPDAYTALKHAVQERYPFFDDNALDAGRFVYGSTSPKVIWHEGGKTIEEFLTSALSAERVIPAGKRNATMSHFAGKVVKRFGHGDDAYQIFLSAIGKVYVEAMIIAYGEGRNGKSTFWNTISRVLGSYAGHLSADTLTVGCKRNVKPEMAETKGKRLIIAAELEEGMRLNTSVVKQLCSTDEIYAEKKYKAPASFIPSHTVVLYTNHLPRVGATDEGTWRRLIVIPFNAVFEGSNDKKNYTDYLVQEAGPAVLTWIINGAKKVIDKDFHLTQPKVVRDAIDSYRNQSDWLGMFLEDCCDVDPGYEAASGELYVQYRAYSQRMGEFARSTAEFYTALETAGFTKVRKKNGRFIKGLRLKIGDFMNEE